MRGWTRDMLWPATGLRWVPTSLHIPDLSVLGYAMSGLGCQEGDFSHGIGSPYPFRLLRYEGKSAAQVKQALERKAIAGLDFRILRTRTQQGAEIEGVYVRVADWHALRPTELSFHLMQLAAAWSAPVNPFANATNSALFNKHVGSTAWWQEISQAGPRARVPSLSPTDAADHFQRQSRHSGLPITRARTPMKAVNRRQLPTAPCWSSSSCTLHRATWRTGVSALRGCSL